MSAERLTLIQGNLYSFHADAAVGMGTPLTECFPVGTHKELYEALRTGDASNAVVAVANSSIGRIVGSYDELFAGDLTVTGRTDLLIDFGLYGVPGATKDNIRVVHTQSHAYRQCATTLTKRFPKAQWQEEQDTAGSALIVQELGDKTHAAICPRRAGEAALLDCLYTSLQDGKNNRTTFYRIGTGENATPPKDADVAVAILDTGDFEQAEKQLHGADIYMAPLCASERDNTPLIVEISTSNHEKTIELAEQMLASVGIIRYLGGYCTSNNTPLTQE